MEQQIIIQNSESVQEIDVFNEDSSQEMPISNSNDLIHPDYTKMSNLPKINDVEIVGNKTGADYGLVDQVEGKALSTNDLTDELKAEYDSTVGDAHTHDNKSDLDNVSGTNTGDETNSTIISKIGFTPEDSSNRDKALGYCPLDGGKKVPLANLPSTLLIYQSVWDASTNTPALTSPDLDKKGYVYTVSVAGTQFGISFKVGDWLIYNINGIPEKSDNSDDVTSVNLKTGAVELDADDIPDAETTKKFTTTEEKNKVAKAIISSDSTILNARVLTQAEYDALTQKNNDTLYFIK